MGARIDPKTVLPEPGESATLAWRLQSADTVVFACNIPGHFEAGMRHDLAIMGSIHSHSPTARKSTRMSRSLPIRIRSYLVNTLLDV
jgi:hypothetical protein